MEDDERALYEPLRPFTIRVRWSEEDGEFVATCDEFPSLSCLDLNPTMAFAEMADLVLRTVADMIENGERLLAAKS